MEKKEKGKSEELVWDCGSSLYDSFELKSFERQLDSAISSRTLSMPHLSNHNGSKVFRKPPPPQQQQQYSSQPQHYQQQQQQQQRFYASKKAPSLSSNKISRSFQKLIRSLFKSKHNSTNDHKSLMFRALHDSDDRDHRSSSSRRLTTIHEGPEFDSLSPEIRSLVTRASSERFTTTPVGISCA